jgi:hypothetical protein
VILRSNNTIKGTLRAKVGESFEDVKNRVLEQEGIKNQESFLISQEEDSRVIVKSSRSPRRRTDSHSGSR